MDFILAQVRLLVTEYEACYHFYRDTLGLPIGFEDDIYASFKLRDGMIAIYSRPMMAEHIGASDLPVTAESQDRFVLQLQVDDIEQTLDQLRAKGVAIVQELTTRPTWGARTAHIRDPDGTLIEISQWLA